MALAHLRQSPMMAYLLDALADGQDIGHYGRLTVAIVGSYFLDRDSLVRLLQQGRGADAGEVKVLALQASKHHYNPPRAPKSWNGSSTRISHSAPLRTIRIPATSTAICASPTRSTRTSRRTGSSGATPAERRARCVPPRDLLVDPVELKAGHREKADGDQPRRKRRSRNGKRARDGKRRCGPLRQHESALAALALQSALGLRHRHDAGTRGGGLGIPHAEPRDHCPHQALQSPLAEPLDAAPRRWTPLVRWPLGTSGAQHWTSIRDAALG